MLPVLGDYHMNQCPISHLVWHAFELSLHNGHGVSVRHRSHCKKGQKTTNKGKKYDSLNRSVI